MNELTIIGGGLAGCEAAWQAAQRDIRVSLYEMRPHVKTGAHTTDHLAELVCSNSLGSTLPNHASGVLKEELRLARSLLVDCAHQASLPAGSALAVDRIEFSRLLTEQLSNHPNITILRQEVKTIPVGPVIIASGPLTSPSLSDAIQQLTGQDNLFFFDAIAPIVSRDSIDMKVAFRASRYRIGEKDEGDYINCPFTQVQFQIFVQALLSAERIPLKSFEGSIRSGIDAGDNRFFEGCLPIEVMAERGSETLSYGPMRPVGLRDPNDDTRPYAVVQLRQDDLAGNLYNLVGFQTNLKFPEQKKVFRLIPGLEQAEFVRYGQMHRNTFISAPTLLNSTLQFKNRSDLFFAGQLTGVEGYLGNIGTGLIAGVQAAHYLKGQPTLELPLTTMLGALCHYITHASLKDFQPMKANFGILPGFTPHIRDKHERTHAFTVRAISDMQQWLVYSGFLE